MAVKVHVKNFQSLRDTGLEVKGFTALSGPNNSGKTALMRAIRGVFQNTPGTSFITHGAESSEVSLSFSDGRTLSWKKGSSARSKPTYIVDGGKPIHPGRGVPDEVRDFGVTPIKVMGQDVWPTLAPQFTGQVFLLDQPGSALAEAVADVDRVAKLNGALRSSDRDQRAVSSKLKVRREDRDTLIDDLQSFEGLDTIDGVVAAIELDILRADKIRRVLDIIQGYQIRWTRACADVLRLAPIEVVCLPEPDTAQTLWTRLSELCQVQPTLRHAQQAAALLEPVRGIQVPADARQQLFELLAEWEALCGLRASRRAAEGDVAQLTGIETIPLMDVDTGRAPEALKALAILRGFQEQHRAAQQQVLEQERELQEFSSLVVQVEVEVGDLLSELGVCPTCGSDRGDHIHV